MTSVCSPAMENKVLVLFRFQGLVLSFSCFTFSVLLFHRGMCKYVFSGKGKKRDCMAVLMGKQAQLVPSAIYHPDLQQPESANMTRKEKKRKTTPFGVNLMRSQVLYEAASGVTTILSQACTTLLKELRATSSRTLTPSLTA